MTHELVQGLAAQPFALPLGVVHVLNRQRLEPGVPALLRRGIRRAELTREDSGRPGVKDDVVHDEHEHVVVGRELEQTGTPEWRGGEIEWPTSHLHGYLTSLRLVAHSFDDQVDV